MNPNQLDLEDWELLPDEGFLEINEDGVGGKKIIYSRGDAIASTTVFQTNYFVCPNDLLLREKEDHLSGDDLDLDLVSQGFFTKNMETEFLDIKVESPKSRGIVPEKEVSVDTNLEVGDEAGGGPTTVFNIWKWSSTGIGAICSFGVAAATVCIVIFSNSQRKNHKHKIHFQIYTDDQRMNRVVHHASKIHEAISAAGGAAITRAHITFGGYYDASAT